LILDQRPIHRNSKQKQLPIIVILRIQVIFDITLWKRGAFPVALAKISMAVICSSAIEAAEIIDSRGTNIPSVLQKHQQDLPFISNFITLQPL
jgi:hypothetical protein